MGPHDQGGAEKSVQLHIYTIEFYVVLKKNEIIKSVSKWMNFKISYTE